ncbi:MAG: DUF4159 domain-containing protein [Planctomycetes bacterium]|nr:DUF4159 domain-containing protein [Planctomycetota bacterium]MCG2682950.1 DUF4159 domain-containing protein [Planctomycetales bacterium]
MMRLTAIPLLATWSFGAIVGTVRAELAAEQVRQAIDRGVNYLKGQQRADGSWIDALGFEGGISSLSALALLNSGVAPDDETMQKALIYLRKIKSEKTYVVALQTMVFARAEPEKDRLLIRSNVKWLEGNQIAAGPYKGAWTYSTCPGCSGEGDNSNAQFALLALHEAERVGVPANSRTWLLAKNYWSGKESQNADGSWGYKLRQPGTGSMTCAGITSLVIASGQVSACDARVVGERIDCCPGGEDDVADRVENGLRWLGQHYSISRNPGNQIWLLYYLYGLERVGRLTARRFIPLPSRQGQPNRADWYREGAEMLVRRQDGLSGYWTGMGGAETQPIVGTSFALLFLSKGRWPVLLGKLQHGAGNDWNRHRGDVANLTGYVERGWKRDMTWQVIDLRLADVEDLLQTPVLYLCGSLSPLPQQPAEQKELAQKLRDYLDRGGFLLAEGYCGGTGFDRGFRELMRQVFPEPEYKLRLLEPEHPIWYAEEKVDPRQLRPLWGVEFGCRTSVIHAPVDPPGNPPPSLSCLWELSRPGREKKYSRVVQEQIDAAMALGINILAYATNRELKSKEDFFLSKTTRRASDRIERGRLYVATLRHPGGCNSAPRAVVNLMDAAADQLRLRTHVREQPLAITDDALLDHHLVFMHGRTAFRLTDAERKRLKLYLERGGMVLADSICASRAFSESFRREMAAVFPDHKLERIAADDPLLSTKYGGSDLRIVSRRDPESAGEGKPLKDNIRKVPPDLEGIKFGDRWGVVFSPFDLSCALEKHATLECRGYTREDAARIGLNVLLYSLQQ